MRAGIGTNTRISPCISTVRFVIIKLYQTECPYVRLCTSLNCFKTPKIVNMNHSRMSSDLLIAAEKHPGISKIECLISVEDNISEGTANLITGVIEDGKNPIVEPCVMSIFEMIKDS
jgi:hypothetical protein